MDPIVWLIFSANIGISTFLMWQNHRLNMLSFEREKKLLSMISRSQNVIASKDFSTFVQLEHQENPSNVTELEKSVSEEEIHYQSSMGNY